MTDDEFRAAFAAHDREEAEKAGVALRAGLDNVADELVKAFRRGEIGIVKFAELGIRLAEQIRILDSSYLHVQT